MKIDKFIGFVLVSIMALGVVSCGGGSSCDNLDNNSTSGSTITHPNKQIGVHFKRRHFLSAHDYDSIGWISQTKWKEAKWYGTI